MLGMQAETIATSLVDGHLRHQHLVTQSLCLHFESISWKTSCWCPADGPEHASNDAKHEHEQLTGKHGGEAARAQGGS